MTSFAEELNACWACGLISTEGVCIGPHKEEQWREHYKRNVSAAIPGGGYRRWDEYNSLPRLPAPLELPRISSVNLPAPIYGSGTLHCGDGRVLVFAKGSRLIIEEQ